MKGEKKPYERRRYPVGHDPRREKRYEEAVERQAAYDRLSRDEKIALVLSRPGKAARELARLGA